MHTNLAARAGRWSATHRKSAILGWFAFVLISAALGFGLAGGLNEPRDSDLGVGESGRAERTIDAHFPDTVGEQMLVRGGSAAARSAAASDLVRRLEASPVVEEVEPVVRSQDATLVGFELRDEDDLAATDRIRSAVAAAHPALTLGQIGGASFERAFDETMEKDFAKAEKLSLPVTLGILLVAFGSLVAAGLPLLLALSSVMATMGVLAGVSQLFPMEETVNSVVLLVGLAVGVDYSLFYLRREREERAAGRSAEAALEAAAATSGRAVLISGLTVMVAMAGMYFAGAATFTAMASGTILVVAVALVASVTVLPALLSKLGDRVERGRVPLLGRRRSEGRMWGFVLDRVLRHPKLAAVLSAGLLVAMIIPALGMKTAQPGMDSLPRDLAVMQTYDAVQAAFPGREIPAAVVVHGDDVRSAPVEGAIRSLERRAVDTGRFGEISEVDVSPDGRVAIVDLPLLRGDGTDDASVAALRELRDDVIPAAFTGVGASVAVAGMTAGTQDFNDLMAERVPIVFAFVLALAFILLLVTFRSVVVPIKAIVLNLLSVGASYGVLTLVFQHGWFESALGFESNGAITSWLPLFLFVILFGLSMDYHVFILSRVREAVDRGMPTDRAVAHAIKSTAGTVTSAAMIMIGVFAIFGTLSQLEFKQMGVGLAVAILLDATLVRAILLPSVMALLGERNWWLPRRLSWLPRVAHEAPVVRPVAPQRS